MALEFFSLGSGSSGNCYYLGDGSYGILLDAGLSLRRIRKLLKDYQIGLEQILAVFITHDHGDHIKSVGVLGEKYGIPIYATEAVHSGIENGFCLNEKLYGSRRILEKGQSVNVREFQVTAFEVPHDASDCVGYIVQYEQHNLVLATDVGRIDETAACYIRMANHLIIEANYDREMLEKGYYPRFLKSRISDGNGHLCNTETADFLAANFSSHLRNIWLCHLSRQNNHPELAYKTVEKSLIQQGIRIGTDVNLFALRRTSPSKMFILE